MITNETFRYVRKTWPDGRWVIDIQSMTWNDVKEYAMAVYGVTLTDFDLECFGQGEAGNVLWLSSESYFQRNYTSKLYELH